MCKRIKPWRKGESKTPDLVHAKHVRSNVGILSLETSCLMPLVLLHQLMKSGSIELQSSGGGFLSNRFCSITLEVGLVVLAYSLGCTACPKLVSLSKNESTFEGVPNFGCTKLVSKRPSGITTITRSIPKVPTRLLQSKSNAGSTPQLCKRIKPGERGNRTPDLVHAKHALYQLSYSPCQCSVSDCEAEVCS